MSKDRDKRPLLAAESTDKPHIFQQCQIKHPATWCPRAKKDPSVQKKDPSVCNISTPCPVGGHMPIGLSSGFCPNNSSTTRYGTRSEPFCARPAVQCDHERRADGDHGAHMFKVQSFGAVSINQFFSFLL
jgi:hypothetical protein